MTKEKAPVQNDMSSPLAEEDVNDACKPSEEGTSLQKEQKLQKEYDELYDRYLRLAADFENYQRRSVREREEIAFHSSAEIASDMLEILDNIERALKEDDEALRQGLEQILKLILQILTRHTIIPIECRNLLFDPETQEAIACVPSEHEEGIVIDEIQKGYRMKNKVLRCARVAVSRGPENEIKE